MRWKTERHCFKKYRFNWFIKHIPKYDQTHSKWWCFRFVHSYNGRPLIALKVANQIRNSSIFQYIIILYDNNLRQIITIIIIITIVTSVQLTGDWSVKSTQNETAWLHSYVSLDTLVWNWKCLNWKWPK